MGKIRTDTILFVSELFFYKKFISFISNHKRRIITTKFYWAVKNAIENTFELFKIKLQKARNGEEQDAEKLKNSAISDICLISALFQNK